MTPAEFNHSVHTAAGPPGGWSAALCALWWLARGDWERAHASVQEDASADGAWVHAHLHRVEGDVGNAEYWYRRAGRRPASGALDAERTEIIGALVARAPDR